MTKKHLFICEACGYETYKWMGRCPRCSAWDTIKEQKIEREGSSSTIKERPVLISTDVTEEERIYTGIAELDRVLGGGMTRGSSILLGGDPGIGKTTLCFEMASSLVKLGLNVLYVSGEESLKQLSLRARRLNIKDLFHILTTNHLDDVISALEERPYGLVIIDSIQSLYNPSLPMMPGSVGQIKEVSLRLIMEMKRRDTAHIFIGHVTKEGAIAGPKIIEHMVDTVLYFEGDRVLPYRILRAIKNRFGPVDEVGIFQMQEKGLISVENPSQFFISERGEMASGSSLFPYITGSRPIILEVQAVTPKTNFSMPKRIALGYDINRLFIIIAILEKAMGRSIFDRDIYVNVTGGIKVTEPAIDLAVAASILSSLKDINTGRDTGFFGEIGLTGEVRKTVNMDLRLKECERLGIKRVFCPKVMERPAGMDVIPVRNIRELLSHLTKNPL